uniref:Uncharacterized protein n=1 Tax=Aegilops tauschii TaxID=37682 RepID=M8BDG3_AEGTA
MSPPPPPPASGGRLDLDGVLVALLTICVIWADGFISSHVLGEKLGEGIGSTRKEVQHQAAEISLRNLARDYGV